MSNWPRYVKYTERLTPGAAPIEVEIPQTRDDAFDWLAMVGRLAADDPVAWKATVRQGTACDWYLLAFFLSGTQRLDPFTGRPEWDCDFIFNWMRECQFDGDNVIDMTAREHGKTSIRCYVGVTNEVVRNPEASIGIFSFEKAAAEKNGRRLRDEWSTNRELKAAWDDVFFADPERDSPLWSMDRGLTVKRSIVSPMPTVSWYSIVELPVGARLSLGILDDVETEKTVATEEMRKQTWSRVQNAFNLGGRGCRWFVNGTYHSPAGLLAELIKTGGWRVRAHRAEDTTQDAPDIATLYDECGGMLPLRDETRKIPLPEAVRGVKLAGKPVYLHPLECALKRLRSGNATYEMHNMCDPLGGQDKRFMPEWIRYFDVPPNEWARGANLYITLDPSKGVGDPSFARVEACKADGTISWVGGFRRKLSPSELGPAVFALAMDWVRIGRLVEIRVEEFAQSTYSHIIRNYFEARNQYVCPIVPCSRHTTNNRQREWAGLEPLYRAGKRLYPRQGLIVEDERGTPFDLVEHYVKNEYSMFPLPVTDDGLAADFLLAVTKGKTEAGKEIDLELEFPESEEEEERRVRSEGRRYEGHRSISHPDSTWMSEGFM